MKNQKQKKQKSKVYVALLNMGDTLAGLETALYQWMREKTDQYDFKFGLRREVPTDSNRNHIVYDFLQTDCDYLAMFDSDNFPLKNPFDLIAFDKDVIGGVYPGMGKNGIRFHVYKAVEGYPEKIGFDQMPIEARVGLAKVDAIGTGCIFIKRKVLEKIKSPFSYIYNAYGVLMASDDIAFCHRCNLAGLEIYAHWDYPCSHFKVVDLLKVAGLIVSAANSGVPKLSKKML